jgi:hypothetical protein
MNPEYISFESMLPAATTYQFWVPEYQRAYVWDSEHLHGLWRDLGEIYQNEESNQNHFLGIVLQKVASQARNPTTRKELIDGQQRVTTILLLLAAIRDHLAEAASPPRKVKYSTDPLFFVRDALDVNRATEFYVLELQKADHAELKAVALGSWRKRFATRRNWGRILLAYEYFRYCLWVGRASFNEVQPYLLRTPKPAELKKFPTIEGFWAHRRLVDQLSNPKADIEGNRLQSIVRSRLKFLCVTLDAQDEDPVVVFDSVNGKRMEFSQWDHAKTYFFRRIGTADESTYQQWTSFEARFQAFAKEAGPGRRVGSGLGEDLLYNFLISEGRGDSERANKQRSAVQLRRLLLRLHNDKEPTSAELVSFLKTRFYPSAEAFLFLNGETACLESQEGKSLPDRFKRQLKQIQAFSQGPPDPAVVAGLVAWKKLEITDDELRALLQAVEVYLARYFLSLREFSPLRSRFMQFLTASNKESSSEANRILALGKALIDASATDNEILNVHCIERRPIFDSGHSGRIAAVFRGIELFRCGEAAHPLPHGKKKSEFEVEHIFPQSCVPTLNKDWQSDLSAWNRTSQAAEYQKRCHSLGNLAMLAGYANQAARNRGFERKKLALGGVKSGGKSAKTPTVLLEICQDVVGLNEWTPEAIDARTDNLIKDALLHWKR